VVVALVVMLSSTSTEAVLIGSVLRDATSADEATLRAFDLGPTRSRGLDEVAEILDGLVSWRESQSEAGVDRRVIVADDQGSLVAVAAHERIDTPGWGRCRIIVT
jgi:hypothetical protein